MVETGRTETDHIPASMRLGVVVERRESRHPWGAPHWHPVAVVPGGAPDDSQRPLRSGDGWTQWYAGTLDLALFAGETDGYRDNLAAAAPQVFVVLRACEDSDGVEPFLVTACPYEAQAYLDSGEETVEGVTMPDAVTGWLRAFVDRHHVDQPFVKRKQKPKRNRPDADPFWREPPVARRGR